MALSQISSSPDLESVQETLKQMVAQRVSRPTWQEDFYQELLIHFWQVTQRVPGCTRSWYLQSCRFRLQHLIRDQVTCDRRLIGHPAELESGAEFDPIPTWERSGSDDEVLSEVCAQDVLGQLKQRLAWRETVVLMGTVAGLTARELANRLKVSHTVVIKLRRRIETVARQFCFA